MGVLKEQQGGRRDRTGQAGGCMAGKRGRGGTGRPGQVGLRLWEDL